MAVVDSGRNRHVQLALSLNAALAVARVARRLDDLACAATAVARDDIHDLAEHRRANRPEPAGSLALGADDRVRPRLGARAAARLAASQGAELDLLVGP